MTRVLFVHGTGVRDKHPALFDRVCRGFAKLDRPDLVVESCFWGEKHGAKLALGGASIPAYLSAAPDYSAIDDPYAACRSCEAGRAVAN